MNLLSIFKKKPREPYKKVDMQDSDFITRQIEYHGEVKFDIGMAMLRRIKPNCPAIAIHDMKIDNLETFLKGAL